MLFPLVIAKLDLDAFPNGVYFGLHILVVVLKLPDFFRVQSIGLLRPA